MTTIYYHVRPRYTPGSPAMVDEATAKRVAQEEQLAFQHVLEGIYGVETQGRGRDMGLGPLVDRHGVRRGIAEATVEHTGHWLVLDLVVGELYRRPFDPGVPQVRSCRRCDAALETGQLR